VNEHRAFKGHLYGELARVGKALASPQRLELLDLLTQGARTVEDLAHEVSLSVANTSRHLRLLHAARLVETRRAGLHIYYRLADASVYDLWRTLRDVGAQRLAEVERLGQAMGAADGDLRPVSRAELRALLTSGEALALDVRPTLEYSQGHIAGARSIPIDELVRRLNELPHDLEIVAYCRGPYCFFSSEAVALLAAHGYRARRLVEGFPEWRAAGLPVEAMAPGSASGATDV
jgi:rhodanese-related sulfurtransferase